MSMPSIAGSAFGGTKSGQYKEKEESRERGARGVPRTGARKPHERNTVQRHFLLCSQILSRSVLRTVPSAYTLNRSLQLLVLFPFLPLTLSRPQATPLCPTPAGISPRQRSGRDVICIAAENLINP